MPTERKTRPSAYESSAHKWLWDKGNQGDRNEGQTNPIITEFTAILQGRQSGSRPRTAHFRNSIRIVGEHRYQSTDAKTICA